MTVTSSQRASLIEKHRDINIHHEWWDSEYESFTEDMKEVGVAVARMYFSGFWSQGDGACFEGCLDNALTYLDRHHKDQFPMIRKLLELGGGVYVQCRHSGHYCHEYCTNFTVEADAMHNCVESRSELQDAVIEQWQDLLDKEMSDFEEAVIEQWRTYMRALYSRLEQEYDHLTSDEAVWDSIVADELDEDEDEDEDERDEYETVA